MKEKDFISIIDHVVIHHPESNLKIKIFNASESDQNKSSFYKNFNVTANDLKEKKTFITPIAATKNIRISKFPEESPLKKLQKL